MLISPFIVTSWFDTVCIIVTRWVNFRENHLHEYELDLSDSNIYRSILTHIYIYFWYYLQKFISKNVNKYFSTRNVHSGENTSKYCSRIIVVYIYATVFFLKFTQRVTILQTVSNQEEMTE